MRLFTCVALLSAAAIPGFSAPVSTGSVSRRGLLDLDLGLCLDLSLLGLVNLDINKSGCSSKGTEQKPIKVDKEICGQIRNNNVNPDDIYVHCEQHWSTREAEHDNNNGYYKSETGPTGYGNAGYKSVAPEHENTGYKTVAPEHENAGYKTVTPKHENTGYKAVVPEYHSKNGADCDTAPKHENAGYKAVAPAYVANPAY
ncbi:hypothetical protein DL89DRAFT_39642 [Linderina pennispora]|uniref:Uncharacterized protein n=1 Tax=Linderina pennispora TaxID=61395 RepID=A0A1Y1W388_9FUNG|nr:uncharacterized protein DL89DRAFT_39642 [Linderina pennispora]ORX67991.1 hypothetical protein DL89DRAFT_39642 [Linderina pennispora]